MNCSAAYSTDNVPATIDVGQLCTEDGSRGRQSEENGSDGGELIVQPSRLVHIHCLERHLQQGEYVFYSFEEGCRPASSSSPSQIPYDPCRCDRVWPAKRRLDFHTQTSPPERIYIFLSSRSSRTYNIRTLGVLVLENGHIDCHLRASSAANVLRQILESEHSCDIFDSQKEYTATLDVPDTQPAEARTWTRLHRHPQGWPWLEGPWSRECPVRGTKSTAPTRPASRHVCAKEWMWWLRCRHIAYFFWGDSPIRTKCALVDYTISDIIIFITRSLGTIIGIETSNKWQSRKNLKAFANTQNGICQLKIENFYE